MKIGIMGGTFDPIHNGHLHLAQTALTQFDLDQIWFMPNGMPPHKKQSSIESDIHERIAMTQIAIKTNKQFYLQEYEAKREKVSYSYKTMEHFRKMYPCDEFYFIIGADSLFSIETWKHPERLFIRLTSITSLLREQRSFTSAIRFYSHADSFRKMRFQKQQV